MIKIQKFKNSLTGGGVLVAALMATNFFNFLFNAILGRVLTLEQFSFFTLANTLWFLIIIFLNSMASTTNNRTAYLLAKRGEGVAEGFRSHIVKRGSVLSLILTLIWILLIPIFSLIFHTSNYFLYLFLAPTIFLGILTAINRGFFQGTFSFAKAAIIILTESVSKFVYALFFVFLGFQSNAYLAIPLSILTAFVVSYIFVKHAKIKENINYDYVFPRKLLIATFFTTLSSAAFLSVDLLLARNFLSATESGAYSLLSLVGKMVYFFGGILNVFILTLASRDTGLNKNSTINFYKIITVNIILLSISFVLLGLSGGLFVPILFGEKSNVILPYLSQYIFGIGLFTLAAAFSTYHLAKQQFIFVYSGIFSVLLAVIGIIIWHSNIQSFISVIIFSSFFYLALNLILHVFYKDISEYIDEEDIRKFGDFEKIKNNSLSVSICIPAYNEAKNIGKLLDKLLSQRTRVIKINKIIVVSSASTDKTDEIVQKYSKENNHVFLIREKERLGKATAINTFLKKVNDPVVVVQSADTLPMEDTIEKLCRPFIIDRKIGMTGGAPIPLNDKNTFLGYVIHTWWWFHRRIPRFGEIIAFKNIIKEVSPRTSVDEAYIQAKFAQLGYKNVHVDEAKIYNKGSENIKDIIKQRRRIFNGHTRLNKEENIHISHVSKSGIKLLFLEYKIYGLNQLVWLMGGVAIELTANILGRWDKHVGRINPVAWDIAHSTKDLSLNEKGKSS